MSTYCNNHNSVQRQTTATVAIIEDLPFFTTDEIWKSKKRRRREYIVLMLTRGKVNMKYSMAHQQEGRSQILPPLKSPVFIPPPS